MERRENNREFDIGPFRPAKVKSAIKATKNGKATGLDNIIVATPKKKNRLKRADKAI